jgi:peptide/nickel transport system permease protein
LPNVAPILVVQLSLTAGVAILAEAGLTFLGYGAAPAEASWGRVLADAQKYIGIAPASVIWPGLAIGLTVLALNLLGDAVGEAIDPRLAEVGRHGA